ncbi:MAG: polysaccharide deacetylase family protein [Ktedonobacterales bacterium]|nr:polysaccharide deacetylase family protein [Ktedonobacterales bacterium]
MPDQPAHADIADAATQRVAATSAITQQPTQRLPSPPQPRARKGRRWLVSVLAVVLVALVGGTTLLVSHSTTGSITQIFRPNATATPTPPQKTPLPGVTMAQRNAATGCAAGAPPPYAGLINNGRYPGTASPPLNEVALTFDDGPTPYSTPTILAFLEKTHTPATFFVEGQFADLWPTLVQREWNDGFAIGAHSWNHRNLTALAPDELQRQFSATMAAIHKALGKNMCLWLSRPPYGSAKMREITLAASYGLSTINWDDSSADWLRSGANAIAQTVLDQIRPGGIVLMHDGPAEREQTAQALPLILAGLQARGLKPVTIPQLLQDGHFPGVVVHPLPNQPTGTPPPDNVPQAWVAPQRPAGMA